MKQKINRAEFYKIVRREFGRLTQAQVNGFEAFLNEWERVGYTDIRWLAYIFATVWHETARTMQPIEEFGRGRGKRYGIKQKHNRESYTNPDVIYYGRGHVQLTWYENYELMGRLLGVDLLNKPELALQMDISVRITFEGMTRGSSSFGDFTGRSLEQYFNSRVDDPINARRIINLLDKAELIASYHYKFLAALS